MRKFSEIYKDVVLNEDMAKLVKEWPDAWNDYIQIDVDDIAGRPPKEAPYKNYIVYLARPWKTDKRYLLFYWYAPGNVDVGAIYEISKSVWQKEVVPAYETYKARWGTRNPEGYLKEPHGEMAAAAAGDFLEGGYREPGFKDGILYKEIVNKIHTAVITPDMILVDAPKIKGTKLVGIYSPEENIQHYLDMEAAAKRRKEADEKEEKEWKEAWKRAEGNGMAQYELRWRASHGYGPTDSINGRGPWE